MTTSLTETYISKHAKIPTTYKGNMTSAMQHNNALAL